MKAKKLLALVLALGMVLALFAGCTDDNAGTSTSDTAEVSTDDTPVTSEAPSVEDEDTPEISGEPIKIGHICDLTGVESSVGIQAKEAFDYAVKALGGEINGRPVEVIVGDSQSSPSVAVDVAKKMVEQDGVVAIFGPTQIGHKTAVAEYIETVGIPLLFYNGTPTGLLASSNWLVGAEGATPQMPSVMADYCYNELGYRSVYTLAMDNTGGRSYIEPFVATFEALGGKVIQQQWAPVPCSDFSPYLVTLGEADAIVAWTSSSDAISLWGAWSDLGLKDKLPMVASFHGGMTDFFVPMALSKGNAAAAEAMLGTVAPIMYCYDIDSPENQEFVDGWEAEFGKLPGGTNLPGATYQTYLLFKTALESINGDTDPDKLIEAIYASDIIGPAGHLYFDEGSHAATKDVYVVEVVQLEDGSFNYAVQKKYEDVPSTGLNG